MIAVGVLKAVSVVGVLQTRVMLVGVLQAHACSGYKRVPGLAALRS